MLENYKCGDYVFDANFDSGNLHSVELVHLHEGELCVIKNKPTFNESRNRLFPYPGCYIIR